MPVELDEYHKLMISMFIKGLSLKIANNVHLLLYLSFNDDCNLTIKLEKQLKQRKPFLDPTAN